MYCVKPDLHGGLFVCSNSAIRLLESVAYCTFVSVQMKCHVVSAVARGHMDGHTQFLKCVLKFSRKQPQDVVGTHVRMRAAASENSGTLICTS